MTWILIAIISFLFCCVKTGFFLDEIYTYGLSNSEYAPWLMDVKEGDIRDKIITKQELLDYVAVNNEDRFNYGSVYYNQSNDVHPPLYYFFVHTVSSLFPNIFSKWIGLSINLVFFALTLMILFRVTYKVSESHYSAMLVVLIYGLSTVGISTMLMIRMYMLLTLLTMILAYLILCHMDKARSLLYPLITVTIFLGMLTQYYFVIYAFFVCATYDIYLLMKWEYKKALLFSMSAMLGVILMLASFPYCISQMFLQTTVSADTTINNFKQISNWLPRIYNLASKLYKQSFVGWWVIIGLILVLLLTKSRRKEKIVTNNTFCIIILPAYISFAIIAIIAPYDSLRYVYNLVPILLLTISCLEQNIPISLKKTYRYCIPIVIFVLVYGLYAEKPSYLYKEHEDIHNITEVYRNNLCIYLTDNNRPPITDSIPWLLYFDEIYVSNKSDLEQLEKYVKNGMHPKEIIAFFSIYPENVSDEYIAKVGQTLGLYNYEKLYGSSFYRAYRLYE